MFVRENAEVFQNSLHKLRIHFGGRQALVLHQKFLQNEFRSGVDVEFCVLIIKSTDTETPEIYLD